MGSVHTQAPKSCLSCSMGWRLFVLALLQCYDKARAIFCLTEIQTTGSIHTAFSKKKKTLHSDKQEAWAGSSKCGLTLEQSSQIAPKNAGFLKKELLYLHIWFPRGLLSEQGIPTIILHHTHLAVPIFHISFAWGTHLSAPGARGHCTRPHALCGLAST